MHYYLGTNSCKKRDVPTLNSASHINQKSSVTCVVGQNNSRVVHIASSESCQANRDLFGVRTTTKSITLLYPEYGFYQQNGSKRLFEWWMLFVMVRGYCIILTKIKTMSICLFWLFEEILSKQYFCNIQRKANYPRAVQKFEISHQVYIKIFLLVCSVFIIQ